MAYIGIVVLIIRYGACNNYFTNLFFITFYDHTQRQTHMKIDNDKLHQYSTLPNLHKTEVSVSSSQRLDLLRLYPKTMSRFIAVHIVFGKINS